MGPSLALTVSFLLYTLGIVVVGLYSARYASRSTSDYLLARRGLGPWVAALSASASSESGWVTLGLVGAAFSDGVAAFWVVPGCLAGYAFNWWILARPVNRATAAGDVYTMPDLLSALLGRSLAVRLACVAVIFVMMTAYVAAQFNAAGKAFEAVFHVSYPAGVLIGVAIVVAYTFTGGFRAVAWTDFLQGLLMWAALVFLPLITVGEAGGWTALMERLAAVDPSLASPWAGREGMLAAGLVIGWLGIGLGYPGQPHVLVRFMAARDEAAIRRGRVIAMGWGAVVFTGAVVLGLACRVLFADIADAEQALPIAAVRLLPGVAAGLMLAAVLAAICSTADSQLLAASASLSHDLYARLTGKDLDSRHVVAMDRLAVMVVGALAMTLALTENRVIFSFVLYAWAGLGAAFGPPLILALLWGKTTPRGALAGMAAGFATVIVWKNVEALSGSIYELVPAFILSMLATWTVSRLDRRGPAAAINS
ncbi:MAG TPA: sodium/proline symporter [Deltaproteobacteria bacterium]|nr:sodium/proline symporter [Deltaproteobacteria bacterium]